MSNGSTSASRSFVLFSTDNRDFAGKHTCDSPAALAVWLESQNEMLTDASASWSRLAELVWSGRSVFVETQNQKSAYLLAPGWVLSFYRQQGRRLVQFEPPVFTFEDFLALRVS